MNDTNLLDANPLGTEWSPSQDLKSHLTSLARNMRQRRLECGLTQETLAHRSGLQRTYISDVERAARNVSFETLIKLAGALGTTVSDLTADVGTPQAPIPHKHLLVLPSCEPGQETVKVRTAATWRRIAEVMAVETCILDEVIAYE